MIVLLLPLLEESLGFMPVGEYPSPHTLTAKRAVEALGEGVLPGATRRDVHRVAVLISQRSQRR